MKAIFSAAVALTLALSGSVRAQPPGAAAKQNGGKKAPEVRQSVKEGDTVPMFALNEFGRDFVFLRKYCGKNRKDPAVKAVLLDFFATDCTACVAKLEGIQALAAEHAPALKTFLISIDTKPEEALPGFLKEKNITLPVLTDMYRKTLSTFGFRTVPQTVLLDGECRAVYIAKKTDQGTTRIKARLKTLLK